MQAAIVDCGDAGTTSVMKIFHDEDRYGIP